MMGGGVFGDGSFDVRGDAVGNGFAGHADSVFHGVGGGAAVGDDGDAVEAEEGHAAGFVGIGLFVDGFEGGFGEDATDFGTGGAHDFAFDHLEDGVGEGFGGFEEDIAGEAVGDDDVGGFVPEVMAFDIADEVEAGGFAQEFAGFLDEGVAFVLFGAVGHEANGGVGAAEDVAGVGGAHDGVLEEVEGLAIGIGAGVDEDPVAGERGHHGGDGGALDVGEGAEFDEGGGDGGAGVAGADDGVGSVFFDEVDGAGDGAVFFAADGVEAGVGHVDDLAGVDDFEFGAGDALGFEFGLDAVFLADEVDFFDVSQLSERELDPSDGVGWGVIATHDVQSDLHASCVSDSRCRNRSG